MQSKDVFWRHHHTEINIGGKRKARMSFGGIITQKINTQNTHKQTGFGSELETRDKRFKKVFFLN